MMARNAESTSNKWFRLLIVLLTVSLAQASSSHAQPVAKDPLWETFKSRFVTEDGRVVDTANNNVSHSEGQGYGMLFAHAYGDLATFEKLWQWTDNTLACRKNDDLFAWRWVPEKGITDINNATDGDLLIAWALLRAAKTWDRPEWKARAAEIARDIRVHLRVRSLRGELLLPGCTGFRLEGGVVVNLSYWVFPAFLELAEIDPSPQWQGLFKTGVQLAQDARFGPQQLPPDWLLVTREDLQIAPDMEQVFGYNAVRVPLYLAWAGVTDARLYEPFRRLYANAGKGGLKALISLPGGDPGNDPALSGMVAIYDLIAGTGNLEPAKLQAPYKDISSEESYYSACLGLLCNVVVSELLIRYNQ